MRLIPFFLLFILIHSNAYSDSTLDLFKMHCASCHGEDRLGLIGPPLIPQSFKRLKPEAAHLVIKNGRAATQMPAFAEVLSDKQVQTLVDYIYTKPEQPPQWDMAAIVRSHKISNAPDTLGNEPVFKADLKNLFLIVEIDEHQVTLLDHVTLLHNLRVTITPYLIQVTLKCCTFTETWMLNRFIST